MNVSLPTKCETKGWPVCVLPGSTLLSQDEFRQRMAEVKILDIPGHPRTGGSTWQSLMRGLPTTEADFLNGEIVLLGKLHGVPTPYNRVLQRVANEMARTGKRPGSMSLEELQRMLAEDENRKR